MKKLFLIFLLLPILGFTQGFQTKTDTIHFLNQNKVIALQDSLNKKIAWTDTGTTANKIIKLDGAAKLPAVDGSQLINLPSSGFDPTTTIEIMEEFVGGEQATGYLGQNGWKTYGSGTTNTGSVLVNRVGLIILKSGTTITAGHVMYLGSPGGAVSIKGNQGRLTFITSSANFQAANADASFRLGLFDATTYGDPPDGIFFRASGIGNWYAVTRALNIETATDCGVAQSTSFRQFKIVSNSNGTSIGFHIDGVLKATHTTNIPTAGIMLALQVTTLSTIDYSMTFDYVHLKITGLTR